MKSKRLKIICGTDFSDRATRAATAAATVSIRSKDTLILVHVLELSALESNRNLPPLEKAARSRLHREAERLRKLGATVEEKFLFGSPYELLVEVAQESDVRLLIVGATGRKAVERWLLGSVAERTAEKSPVPTLVLRDASALEKWASGRKPLSVFIAADFSPHSDAALGWVKELLEIGKCNVTVGHVDWPPESFVRLGSNGPASLLENPAEVQRVLERDIKEKSERILGRRPVRVRVEPGWGRADAHLVLLAEMEKADIVVVGTRQQEGLERVWFGSVSRGILHHAPMSVAIVPMPKEAGKTVPEIRRVLVTTDFSRLGNSAIPQAYAPVVSGGTVYLVHVVPPQNELQKHVKGRHVKELEAARNKLRALAFKDAPRGINTEIAVVEGGNTAEAICQTAERVGADLICIGSHGRSGISKAILGSVAGAVIAKSKRPVLIVRPMKS